MNKEESPQVTSNQAPGPTQSHKVAIVHDWLYGGGAELVVEQLHKMYPEAPIYTSYCSDEWRRRLDNKVITGYLQHWPFSALRKFLPVLRQHWFRRLDLSKFDVVISSSGNGEAKFVLNSKKQNVKSKTGERSPTNGKFKMENDKSNMKPLHICYCHTPTHFYWRKYEEYLKNPSFKPRWLARLGLKVLVKSLRKRDYQAAQWVDYFIANSSHIQKDIKAYYDRESVVIHPPVNAEAFTNPKNQAPDNKKGSPTPASQMENEKWKMKNSDQLQLITWGRHVPYKRFDLAIKACNKLQLPLTIIGSGPETENLKNIAGPTITFTGRVSDEELAMLAHAADAFLFPGEEDFGIAPVEALAAGLPVIAYKSGGALDYVIEGKTGLFFKEQTAASLIKTLEKFQNQNFNKKTILAHAHQFSAEKFKHKLEKYITDTIKT